MKPCSNGHRELLGSGSPRELLGSGSPRELLGSDSPRELLGSGSPRGDDSLLPETTGRDAGVSSSPSAMAEVLPSARRRAEASGRVEPGDNDKWSMGLLPLNLPWSVCSDDASCKGEFGSAL